MTMRKLLFHVNYNLRYTRWRGGEEKESKAWTRATGRVDPNGLSTANGGRDVGGAEGYF